MAVITGTLSAEMRVVPESVEDFLLVPGVPSTLGFLLEGSPASESIEYRVRDYTGEERYRSSASLSEGRVEIVIERDAGYHEIYFPEPDQVFGLGAIDPFVGETDDFFGIDAALSWHAGEARREGLIANLARSGIGIARERVDWAGINPRRGNWHWHPRESSRHPYPGAYERLRITYSDYGIDVLDVFHSAPEWVRNAPYAFPVDLEATSHSWRMIGERWNDYLGGLEVWNGSEGHFGAYVPADQYVPLMRTLRYSWERSGLDVSVGGAGFDFFNPLYMDLAARNELLEEVDYISFHFFSEPLLLESSIARYREWVSDFGHEGMPLWLTASGPGWRQKASRPPFQVQRASSLKYVMNAVEAKAAGVARYFPTAYAWSSQETGSPGMTDQYDSPLRSMVSYFHAVKTLSNREYAGDLELGGDGPIERARVFTGQDGKAVIVLYTAQPAWSQRVTLPFRPEHVTELDGREVSLGAENTVRVTNGLIYVWAESSKVEQHINRETRAAELYAASRTAPRAPAQGSPIVMQPLLGEEWGGGANQIGYTVSPDMDRFLLPVRVHNLSESEVNLELRLREIVDGEAEGTLEVSRVAISGNSFMDVLFDVVATMLNPRQELARVEIRATSDEVDRIAPLLMNFLMPRALDDFIESFSVRQSLSLRDLERRTELSTTRGVGATTMIVTRDGGWRITSDFTEPGDSRLTLNLWSMGNVRWEEVEAVVVRARFERPVRAQLRILTDFDTRHYAVNHLIRRDGEWGIYLFPLNSSHFYTNQRLYVHQIERMNNGLVPVDRMSLEFTHLDLRNTGNVLEISDIIFVGGSE